MTDERCKQLMEQVGMPNSRSLMVALFQVANETEQMTRAPLLERIAELEAKLAYANEVIDQRNAMVSAALSAAPAAPEQQDQSEQHLGMVECRHCGGTGDAPYMTTSPVPYQRTEKCATCDGAGMVAQAPNAQQAEAQEPVAWMPKTWTERYVSGVGAVTCNLRPTDGWIPLFTRPQPEQRPPLTIAEVEQILARWNYELHGDRSRFIARETELAHGITTPSVDREV